MSVLPFPFDPAQFTPLSPAGEAALEVASNGWPVFPCNHLLDLPGKKRNKLPLTEHSFEDASTSASQIRAWWTRFPQAMIGVPAGKTAGVWVLDVDVDPAKGLDGKADLAGLEAANGALPETSEVTTPRGGRHILFRYVEGITTSAGRLPKSINVRGQGGYFIAPPSCRVDGKQYVSENDLEPVDAPCWLVDLVLHKPEKAVVQAAFPAVRRGGKSAYAEAALQRECDAVASQSANRNNRLNSAAFSLGQLVGAGLLDESAVTYGLLSAAAQCGLLQEDGEKQTRATIASGLGKGIADPRRVSELGTELDPVAAVSQRALAKQVNNHVVEIDEIFQDPELRPPALDTSDLGDLAFPSDAYAPASMPGILGLVSQHILETALYPVPNFACLSALVFCSALFGRRWVEPIMGGGLNLYAIATAPTGWGKDHPLQEPRNIAYRAEMMHMMGPGEFKSDSAIEKTLRKGPIRACYMDEIGIVFQANAGRNASSWERRVRKSLLEVYSASKGMWTGSQAAGDHEEKDKGSEPIHRPILSIYGTSTPEELYKGLTEDNIRDGLFGRLIFASPIDKPERQRPGAGHYDDLVTKIEAIRSFTPDGIPEKQKGLYHSGLRNALIPPPITRVEIDGEACAALETIDHWQREITEKESDLSKIANRAAENSGKLAAIRALSRDHTAPIILLDDVKWAWALVERSLFVIAGDIEKHMVGSDWEGLVKAILIYVGEAGRQGTTLYDLRRRRGVGKAHGKDMNAALKMLQDSGEIVLEKTGNRGFRIRRS